MKEVEQMHDHVHGKNGKSIGSAILIIIGSTLIEPIGGILCRSLALVSDAR